MGNVYVADSVSRVAGGIRDGSRGKVVAACVVLFRQDEPVQTHWASTRRLTNAEALGILAFASNTILNGD